MAEAANFNLLETFSTIIEDELELLRGVKEEIVYIRNEFERITAFVEKVEVSGEHDPELKVFASKVREVSYEAGDVLEQFTLRINRSNVGIFRKATHVAMTSRVRHQVATKIRRIKSKLYGITQAYEGHHNLIDIIEQGSSSQTLQKAPWYGTRGDSLFLEDHEVVGIERPRTEIIKWLRNKDHRLQVLSVVGMGGMGKTTLVKKVFDNIETRNIFESYIWLTVSETYKVDELFKEIITQLFEGIGKQVPKEEQQMDNNQLKTTIVNFLREKRYLIVLDDVWHTHVWQALRYAFPDSNLGSRVLLTTRIANVLPQHAKTAMEKF